MIPENRIYDWGEDTAAIIVNICLDVNALKSLCHQGRTTGITRIFQCDEDIGNNLNRLLGAGDREEFRNFLATSRKQVEYIMKINTPEQSHFPVIRPIKIRLKQLYYRLILLEEKINNV